MIERDLFVGIVAVGLGIFVAGSALLNTTGFSRFWLSRRMEKQWGPLVARGVGLLVGVLVAILGVLLSMGMLPARNSRAAQMPDGTDRSARQVALTECGSVAWQTVDICPAAGHPAFVQDASTIPVIQRISADRPV